MTMNIEHIVLSSKEDPDNPSRITNRTLSQNVESTGYTAKFSVFNDSFMSVDIKEFSEKNRKYWINLAHLNPQPLKHSKISGNWFNVSLSMFVIAIMLVFFHTVSSQVLLDDNWLPLTALISAGSLVCLLVAICRTRRKIIFRSKTGDVEILDLVSKQPSAREFNAFMNELQTRISKAGEKYSSNPQQHLAAELKEHRRLRDEGILSNNDYNQVMKKIFNQQAA